MGESIFYLRGPHRELVNPKLKIRHVLYAYLLVPFF